MYLKSTVHLSQYLTNFMHKICFTISFISCFCMFRAHVLIINRLVHETVDNRGRVIQFWPPDDGHICSKHVEAWNKTYCKTKILCIKLVKYWHKYTETHGQQNFKIFESSSHQISLACLFWNKVLKSVNYTFVNDLRDRT